MTKEQLNALRLPKGKSKHSHPAAIVTRMPKQLRDTLNRESALSGYTVNSFVINAIIDAIEKHEASHER